LLITAFTQEEAHRGALFQGSHQVNPTIFNPQQKISLSSVSAQRSLAIMSVRREIRLRKEFLFKKQQTATETVRNEKKRAIKRALDSQIAVPTELRNEARELSRELDLDVTRIGDSAEDDKQAVDDEYAQLGIREPKVCVTTSRDPSSRLKQFAKEIKICIPNSQAVNRGNHRVDDLVDACRKADFTDMIILNETRGMPDGLTISHLPYGPTASFTLSNCVLRHDIPECTPASQAHPHIILDGLSTKVGRRFAKVLQALYPIPRPESKRVITFANNNDFISFRHHMYEKNAKGKVELKEAGPRFEMQPYELRQGTIDQEAAEKEWVLRPYQNTSRKRQAL
jgi:U3 small nucleolar ribonucleoprotein protein IMP4